MKTANYKNRSDSVDVIMDGECIGCNRAAHAAVRKTVDGRFAVIATVGFRLIKAFPSSDRARAYCSAMIGE